MSHKIVEKFSLSLLFSVAAKAISGRPLTVFVEVFRRRWKL